MGYDLTTLELVTLFIEVDLRRLVKCFARLLRDIPEEDETRVLEILDEYVSTGNASLLWMAMGETKSLRIDNLIFAVTLKNPTYFFYCYQSVTRDCFEKKSYFRNLLHFEFGDIVKENIDFVNI